MLTSPFSLAGRRALVTGSSEGIGLAIAVALGRAGAEVVLHGLDENGDDALQAVEAAGARASYLHADFADAAAVDELVGRAGAVDVLVSNVAVQLPQPLGAITADAADTQFQVLTRAFLSLVQGVLPPMRRSRWGRILAVGSVQEIKPHRDMAIYAALKAAQENLVRNLAAQLAPDGVTVNNLAPGVVRTARNAAALADPVYGARVLSRIPLGRAAMPDEVAGAALLLCSEAGSYITGATLRVDGGMSL